MVSVKTPCWYHISAIWYLVTNMCNKREETKKKLQLQYQTYSANHQPHVSDMNYINNSGGQQVTVPSSTLDQRPSVVNLTVAPAASACSKSNEYEACRIGSYQNYTDPSHNNDTLTNKGGFQEQVILSKPIYLLINYLA
ncbi:unnamed protein product [Thelazia callipaeda]|uniref:Ovule protein n=1 Tax=Thelazia callipaeda TaxID=103827 RepID=A0A0N5CTT7_THECL|nr:unnamed protein product [Thelazia callipaeda]